MTYKCGSRPFLWTWLTAGFKQGRTYDLLGAVSIGALLVYFDYLVIKKEKRYGITSI